MHTDEVSCHGLDGANPLTVLASFGVLTIGTQAGLVKSMKWRWEEAWRPTYEVTCGADTFAEALAKALSTEHPVCKVARHLDDISKGGLSRHQFHELARRQDAAPYLPGVACDLHLDSKKTIIARTHLSFSNNNSGKELLKDFAALARRATAESIKEAIYLEGKHRDEITGLGWDPASQRSYALQFNDPQKSVTCNAMHNALAFYGLACLPVVPTANGRETVGVATIKEQAALVDESDEDPDDGQPPHQARSSRLVEYFTWPIWECALAFDEVRGLIAWSALSGEKLSVECTARGVAAVMRSRRFSKDKRSYLAPAKPVV